jgi:hypothetical protein
VKPIKLNYTNLELFSYVCIAFAYSYTYIYIAYSLFFFLGCFGLIVLPQDVVGEEERASLLPFHHSLLYRQLMSSVGDQYRAGKSQVTDHSPSETPGMCRCLLLFSGQLLSEAATCNLG